VRRLVLCAQLTGDVACRHREKSRVAEWLRRDERPGVNGREPDAAEPGFLDAPAQGFVRGLRPVDADDDHAAHTRQRIAPQPTDTVT